MTREANGRRFWSPARQGSGEMTHGVAMGMANVLCNFTFLRAPGLLPGTVVFPTVSAGSVALRAFRGRVGRRAVASD